MRSALEMKDIARREREGGIALSAYIEGRNVVVSIPLKGHSGFGRVACYIYHNSDAKTGWTMHESLPVWLDMDKMEEKFPMLEPMFSLDEIAEASELIK